MPGLNRKSPPSLKSVKSVSLPEPVKRTLANGIDTYTVNMGDDEVCRVDILLDAGRLFEPKHHVAGAYVALFKAGTKSKTNKEITRALDLSGTSLRIGADMDFMTISLFALRKHLDRSLELLIDLINNSIFPERELEIYKKRTSQQLMVNMEKAFLPGFKIFLQ